jgi:hypothetical protein
MGRAKGENSTLLDPRVDLPPGRRRQTGQLGEGRLGEGRLGEQTPRSHRAITGRRANGQFLGECGS